MVLRLLRRRVGRLTPEQEGQIQRLGDDALVALAEALLDFTAAADLDRWLAAH